MDKDQKGKLIGVVITHLRFEAERQTKQFDEGDVFLSLCFKTDQELQKIADLALN